jgi:putative hydrolase of the HAD superfamily
VTLGLIFDLDDTLYPEQSYNFSGFAAVGKYVLHHHCVPDFANVCENLFRAGVRGDIFDRAAQSVGVTLPISDLVSAYREHMPRIELFEDAQWILDDVRGRHPMGLITDGYASVQRRKVAALGIADRFASLVYTDDFGRSAWKPSELPYRRTMANLEGLADRFVYVGDNPTKDFVTARALGWQTVMVDRPTQIHRPADVPPGHRADHRIESLREMPWAQLGANR